MEVKITSKSITAKQPRPLWKNRDYVLLWSGQTISSFGTQASQLAFPLLVLALTHSPIYAGIIGAIRLVPYVALGLLAGAWIDRVDRKRVMISCDVMRVLVLGSIPLMSLFGHLTLIQLYAAALIEGSLYVFFNIAEMSCLPHVVPEEQIPAALGQNQASEGAANLLGPSLGGILYSLHQSFPFLVDAISYAISTISLLFIRTSFQGEKQVVAQRKLSTEIAEGFHWLWQQPLIRSIALSSIGVNFFFAGNTLLVITLLQRQKASSVVIGLMLAMGSIGQIAGSLLGPIIQKRFSYRQIITGMTWGIFLSWSLYLFTSTLLLIGMATAALYLNLPVQIVAASTVCTMLIPDEMRGRVNSVLRIISWCSIPLGSLATGALLQLVGPMTTTMLFSVGFLIMAIAISVNPHIRNAPSWAELQRLHDIAKEAPKVQSQENTKAISHQDNFRILEQPLEPEDLDFSSVQSSNLLSKPSYQQVIDEQIKLLLQHNLDIHEKYLESERPKTVQSLNRLAILYCKQGKYKKAEPLSQRALAIREQYLVPDHPEIAESLNTLAILYYEQGKYKQAEPLLQRAITIREHQLGSKHPETAQSLNNLAMLYCKQGKYEQAELLLLRALVIRKQYLGTNHIKTAQSLNSLAILYYKQGKYEQAKLLSQRALAIREQYLVPDHPEIAESLNTLAVLYYEQGKYKQAEPLLQRAITIRKHQLGSKHPETAQSLNSLAMLYCKQGKYEQAELLSLRALAIRKQYLGLDHPETAQSINVLAMLYYEQRKYEQAEMLLRRALAIREQQLGSEHPDTVQSLNNLAALYHKQGKYEQAEPLYQRVLSISERHLGPMHPDTAKNLNNLAVLYRKQGKYKRAEPLYQRALAINEQQLGPEHPDTVQNLNNLAILYRKQGKYEQAKPLYKRALSISERQLGSQHPRTEKLRKNYFFLLQTMGSNAQVRKVEAGRRS